jgi:hypothetical protein
LLGGVLIGLVAILGEAGKESEATQKRLEAFSQSLGDVAVRAGGGATTRQLQEELAQRQREQASLQEQIERLNGLRERANQLAASVRLSASGSPLNTPELAALEAINAEIRMITGDQVQNFGQLGGVIEALQGKTKDASAEIGAINVLLGSAAVALSDATEAQRLLTEARIKGTQADAEEARQNAIQNGEFTRLTTQQAEARLAQLRDENAGLAAAMEAIGFSYGASTSMIRDATDRFYAAGQNDIEALTSALQAAGVPPELIEQYLAFRDQLRQNKDDIARLNGVYVPLIKNREREEQALKDMVKASEELNKARTKVQDAEAALADEQLRNADALAKINADLLDKQYESNRKAQLAIDEAELDAEQGRVKAAEEAGKKRLEAQRKADEDLLKAQREYNRDFGNAVANRDALAAFEAKQKYDDEKADIKSALKAQKREIEDGYKEQLRTVDARLKDQLRLIEQRKNEELRLATKAANAALAIEVAKHNAEIAARQQALNIAVQQYQMFISQLNAAVQQRNGGQIYLPQVVDLPAVTSQSAAYAQFLAYQRSQIPNYKDGLDYVPRNRYLNYADEGEAILTKQEARKWREGKANGGLSVNIGNIYGSSRREIIRTVDKRLNATLKAAGVPA